MKQQFTEEEIYKDRDSQIAAIEKTFEDAQKAVGSAGGDPPPPAAFQGPPPRIWGVCVCVSQP